MDPKGTLHITPFIIHFERRGKASTREAQNPYRVERDTRYGSLVSLVGAAFIDGSLVGVSLVGATFLDESLVGVRFGWCPLCYRMRSATDKVSI